MSQLEVGLAEAKNSPRSGMSALHVLFSLRQGVDDFCVAKLLQRGEG
jgi:hypothetical protein